MGLEVLSNIGATYKEVPREIIKLDTSNTSNLQYDRGVQTIAQTETKAVKNTENNKANAEGDEKSPHEDGIAGDEGHQRKGQKEIGDGGCGEPQLLMQQLFHGVSSFSRCTMTCSNVGQVTAAPSNSGASSRRMSKVSPARSVQCPNIISCCCGVSSPCLCTSR